MGGFYSRELRYFIQIEIIKGNAQLGNITYCREYPYESALKEDILDIKLLDGIREIYPESILHFWGLIYGDKLEQYKKMSMRNSVQKFQIELMPDIELPGNFSMTNNNVYHNAVFDFNLNVTTSHDDKLKLLVPNIKVLYNTNENLEELFELVHPN